MEGIAFMVKNHYIDGGYTCLIVISLMGYTVTINLRDLAELFLG